MTVQSALLILRATDGEIVSFAGDEDLRSASRKGRRIRSGTQDDSLPDGRLVFRSDSAGERIADIEILTSKYSDAVILKKHEELAEGTIFVAPTQRLAVRTEELTGLKPLLLTP